MNYEIRFWLLIPHEYTNVIVVITIVKMSPMGTLLPNLSKVPTVKSRDIVTKLMMGTRMDVVKNCMFKKLQAVPNMKAVWSL